MKCRFVYVRIVSDYFKVAKNFQGVYNSNCSCHKRPEDTSNLLNVFCDVFCKFVAWEIYS